jgi:biopolymer transport protein ExbD
MIQNNSLKPTLFAKRLLSRRHQQKKTRRVIVAGLMLTSMVDMFSLLVIFLLQSFSNSPEVMALTKGITLPAAVSAAAPIDAPLLTVTETEVLVDSKSMGKIQDVLARPEALVKSLTEMKDTWQERHKTETFKGDIHLQADKKLTSALVSQIIGIVNSQGYASVHLAVVNGSR